MYVPVNIRQTLNIFLPRDIISFPLIQSKNFAHFFFLPCLFPLQWILPQKNQTTPRLSELRWPWPHAVAIDVKFITTNTRKVCHVAPILATVVARRGPPPRPSAYRRPLLAHIWGIIIAF